jgi:hypothetical protein
MQRMDDGDFLYGTDDLAVLDCLLTLWNGIACPGREVDVTFIM